jgi:hypothetical protein
MIDYTKSNNAPAISTGSAAAEIEWTLATLNSITQAEVFEVRIPSKRQRGFFECTKIAAAARLVADFDVASLPAGIYARLIQ